MERFKEIANKSEDIAQFTSKVCFYGNTFQSPKRDDRKKVSYDFALQLARQSATQAQTAILENFYKLVREIKEDETIDDKQKFDLVWGELELCLMENVKWFATRFDNKGAMGGISLEEIRKRYLVN